MRASIVGPPASHEHERFHCRLPFRGLVRGLGKLRNIAAGVLESDKLATAGQRDRIFELALPTPAANDANPS